MAEKYPLLARGVNLESLRLGNDGHHWAICGRQYRLKVVNQNPDPASLIV